MSSYDDHMALLRELVPTARALTAEDRTPQSPPAELWDRIAEQTHGSHRDWTPGPGPEPVTELVSRRRRRPRGAWVLAAAAAVVGVVFLAVWAFVGATSGDVVGEAELQALEDEGSGEAELIEEEGQLQLRVELAEVEAGSDEFLEVWLLDVAGETPGMISLGPVRPDGLYDLPDGVEPSAYPTVDVSREPFDGDPAHSGNSIVRGDLQLS